MSNQEEGLKLWGGRFTGATDPLMDLYNASLPYDKKMYKVDLEGTKVYTEGLEKINLLTKDELSEIHRGLKLIEAEWAEGKFVEKPGDEDIHTANERRLGELIGRGISGKVHTGRSRNDQVATDMRLYVRDNLTQLADYLKQFIQVIIKRAEQEIDVLMPGYTHLQRAQPIRWSHWLSMYATYFTEDYERLNQIVKRLNKSPLGAGALAGHPYGIDREYIAERLGFDSVIGNSLAAVSDRDFVVETMFWSSLFMNHISRFSEDLIIYSTGEFGFIKLADAYSTGSSLMPTKKNPDSLELLRGKSGRCFGALAGFLMSIKSIPSTYNKDMQEDKEPLFDTLITVEHSILIASGVVSTLNIDAERMKNALTMDMLATDLADYLVRRGVPFRETHHISGECVRQAEELNLSGIDQLSLEQLKSIDSRFEADVASTFDFEASVEKRTATGGTSKTAVLKQLDALNEKLES
ncbi:Argininosuccinate lyase, catalyzes the final step in the arginine biosynthesis pathway [Komagataella phaffii GS115]|uniref:argininosuccinate lyase n=1 Tax=Komagataella phaffii (strain GS115 / ATCC 20864) TaxID=644223 RepID=C4QWZ3_KOMPG|nr:Argininosuccinate lyase, catalyzes the final step in the arginine biosynthesis pathway [Komagataella phaffii GS115]CAY67766.1 Argininosuccinate lyase, catalyzes the final step in the arginine biosynthesis pathway [Komagataella phaffii GS115]